MNYIKLIREVWRSHEENSLNTTEIALYVYLLEISNNCNWKNPFKRKNARIEADLSISFNTLKNARNRLQQFNLISFKTVSGSPYVMYSIPNIDEINKGEITEQEINKTVQTFETKKTAPKPKEKKQPKKEEKDSLIMPSEFIPVWDSWIEYRKAKKKKPYASVKYEQIGVNKLLKDSNNNIDIAWSILNQTISNNWEGLFPVKSETVKINYSNAYKAAIVDGEKIIKELETDFINGKIPGVY